MDGMITTADDYKRETKIETLRRRFKFAAEAEADKRALSLEDVRFHSGRQWYDQVERQRKEEGRPCLTINRMPQFTKQVTNEHRAQRPQAIIKPTQNGDVAKEMAEIAEGLCRRIQGHSNAKVAYDNAFQYMTICGFGYLRALTDYEGPDSFDQEIKLEWIKNPFSVYIDPGAQMPNKEDAKWAFVVHDYTKEDFALEYPDAEPYSADAIRSLGDESAMWFPNGGVRVVEYFYVEHESKVLVQFEDGTTGYDGEFNPDNGLAIIRTREVEVPVVKWCKANGLNIIDEGETPFAMIPIVGMYGDQIIVDGVEIVKGMVRDAIDPQRRYNVMVTAETEAISLTPKAPYVIAEGQLEGYEEMWRTANVRNYPYLPYKPVSSGGQVLGAPQRTSYEAPIQAIAMGIEQASRDLMHTTGIYKASLGDQGSEQSGRAILARQKESDIANLNYADNASRAYEHMGRVIMSAVPKVYDAPRLLRIVKGDMSDDVVEINKPTVVKGVERIYDFTAMRYDVTVETGPSYATKREQSAEMMIETAKVIPSVGQFAPDIIVNNLDFPGASEVAKRLKNSLPPGIVEDEGNAEIPPQVQARLAQLDQFAQQATQVIEDLSKQLESKNDEIASKERIAADQNATKIAIEMAKINAQLGQLLMTQEYAAAKHEVDVSNAEQQMERKYQQDIEASQMASQQQPMASGGPTE
jgi:hypothetical protein